MDAVLSPEERAAVTTILDSNTEVSFVEGQLHVVARDAELRIPVPRREPVTTQQLVWYMENDAWENDVIASCALPKCTIHLKLKVPEVTEEDLMQLVEKSSVTLADLYRKGRAKGLLSARSGY